MASMCDTCKCSTYYKEDIDAYACENNCACCNDPDYKSPEDLISEIIAYIKIHHISLWQDLGKIEEFLDAQEDMETDEYRFKETEHISISGQIIGVGHILKYIEDLTNPLRTE